MAKAGPDNPTGAGFSLSQFIGKLFGGDSGPTVSPMGAFDPEQFVNQNLANAQRQKGGLGLKDVLQGVAGLVGIGHHSDMGKTDETEAAGTPEEPDDGAPLTQPIKPAPKLNPTHLKHANDLLTNIISTLSTDPSQGNQ